MTIQLPVEGYDLTNDFGAKWYLNGFPKSGLHLAVQLMKPFLKVMPQGQLHPEPWVGTFKHHSWSEEWQDLQIQMYNLARIKPGHYFKGHCAHRVDLEWFMWHLGLAHVFIFRDLRDVAVSQAYHILSDKDTVHHPAKDRYRVLGGFDEVLEAVIVGLDEFPGVMHRWEAYAPWLSVPWVFKFQFEEAINNPANIAQKLIEYGLGRIEDIFKVELKASEDSWKQMVEAMAASAVDRKEESITFRKGKVGSWKEEFNERHKFLFKKSDKNGWLIKLGYESSSDW